MRCSIAKTNDVSIFRETVFPKTRRKLILCPSGCDVTSISYDMRIDSKYFTCACDKCGCQWYICLNCPRQHTQYLKYRQLKRHQVSCNSATNILNFHRSTLTKFLHFGRKENSKFYFQR